QPIQAVEDVPLAARHLVELRAWVSGDTGADVESVREAREKVGERSGRVRRKVGCFPPTKGACGLVLALEVGDDVNQWARGDLRPALAERRAVAALEHELGLPHGLVA